MNQVAQQIGEFLGVGFNAQTVLDAVITRKRPASSADETAAAREIGEALSNLQNTQLDAQDNAAIQSLLSRGTNQGQFVRPTTTPPSMPGLVPPPPQQRQAASSDWMRPPPIPPPPFQAPSTSASAQYSKWNPQRYVSALRDGGRIADLIVRMSTESIQFLADNFDLNNTNAAFTPKRAFFDLFSVLDTSAQQALRTAYAGTGPVRSSPQQFGPANSTDQNELVRQRLFAVKKNLQAPQTLQNESLFSMTDGNIWKVDSQGRLYREENGQKVMYGADDDATRQLIDAGNNCYGTMATGDCEAYINDCLLNDNGDLTACAGFWSQPNFYNVAAESIKKMHPTIALQTLKKFGFKTRAENDPVLGATIQKVIPVTTWIKNVLAKAWGQKQGANGKTLQTILENNENVLSYLRLLVDYVNANPAILNREKYAGQTVEALGRIQVPDYVAKLGIPLMRLPARNEMLGQDWAMLNSNLLSRQRPIRGMFTQSSLPMGIANASILSGQVPQFQTGQFGMQYGGQLGSQGIPLMAGVPTQFMPGMQLGADQIATMIQSIPGGNVDNSKIQRIVQQIKLQENELKKLNLYLAESLKMRDEGITSPLISDANIQGLFDKQYDLQSSQYSQERTLLGLMRNGLRSSGLPCPEIPDDSCLYNDIDVNPAELPPPPCVPVGQPMCPPGQVPNPRA